MKTEQRAHWGWAFAAAFPLVIFAITGPIHEMWHAILIPLTGGRVVAVHWTWTHVRGTVHWIGVYGGPVGEVLTWTLLAALCLRSRRVYGTAFCWGAVHAALLVNPFGGDFHQTAQFAAGVDFSGRVMAIFVWILFGYLILQVGWPLAWKLLKGGATLEGRTLRSVRGRARLDPHHQAQRSG